MNKIYKLVWSKVRNCYVAVSELAKSHTKAPKSGVMGKTLVAGVLACVLSCGAVVPKAEAYFTDHLGELRLYQFQNSDYVKTDNQSATIRSLRWTGFPVNDAYSTDSIGGVSLNAINAIEPGSDLDYPDGVTYFLDVTDIPTSLVIGDVTTGAKGLADATDVYNALQNLSGGGSTPYIGINSATGGANEDGSGAVGTDAIAIGRGASANDTNAIAIGVNATTTNSENAENCSIAIGVNAKAVSGEDAVSGQTSSIAIGRDANAINSTSIAFGSESLAKGKMSIAMGFRTEADEIASVVIGSDAKSTNSYTVTIGDSASTSSAHAVAIGVNAQANGVGSVALGRYAQTGSLTNGQDISIAIGYGAKAIGDETHASTGELSSVAIGRSAIAKNGYSVSLGHNANAIGNSSIAVGRRAISKSSQGIAIGNFSVANNSYSVALGTDSSTSASDVVSIGHKTTDTNYDGENYTSDYFRRIINVANGEDSHDGATVGQTIELVAGDNVTVTEDGTNSVGQKKYKVSANVEMPEEQNVILYDAEDKSKATLGGRIGTTLGNVKDGLISKSSLEAINGRQLYAVKQDIAGFAEDIERNTNSIQTLNGSVSNALASVAAANTLVNTVNDLKADASLNNLSTAGRQVITNAAIDAVQQYMAQQGTNNVNTGMTTNYNADIFDLTGDLSDDGVAPKTRMLATSLRTVSPMNLLGNVPDNESDSGITTEDLALKADITYVDEELGKKADVTYVDNGLAEKADLLYVDGELAKKADIDYVNDGLSLKADKDSVYSKMETDNFLSEKADITYVDNGLARKADIDSVYSKEEADDLFVGKALMEEELEKKVNVDASNIDVTAWSDKLGVGEVAEGNTGLVNGGTVYNAIQANRNDMITADYDTGAIRIAGSGKYDALGVVDVSKSDGTGRVITGVVTNPEDQTSAANVGYVNTVGQNIANAVNNSFSKMDDKVNKVGANAAALAALTPASFEGDEKWSLAASVGNYRDATAGAVGAFYKPSENVMMNIRGSFGNDENMVAGGVAVALTKGDIPGVTKRQLAKAVNVQAQTISAQAGKIAELEAGREADRAAIANQANEIAELRAMVQQLATNQKG